MAEAIFSGNSHLHQRFQAQVAQQVSRLALHYANKFNLSARERRRHLGVVVAWADRTWESFETADSQFNRHVAAGDAVEACYELIELVPDDPLKQDEFRRQLLRWAGRAWVTRPMPTRADILSTVGRAILATLDIQWTDAEGTARALAREEVWDWCMEVATLDLSACLPRNVSVFFSHVERFAHLVGHGGGAEAIRYHRGVVVFTRMLWDLRPEGEIERTWLLIAVGDVVCSLRQLAHTLGSCSQIEELLHIGLRWINAARHVSEDTVPHMWINAGAHMTAMLLDRELFSTAREGRTLDPDILLELKNGAPWPETTTDFQDAEERLSIVLKLASDMAVVARSGVRYDLNVGGKFLVGALARMVWTVIWRRGVVAASASLQDALVVCTWAKVEAEFWRKFSATLPSQFLDHSRERSVTDLLELLNPPDDVDPRLMLAIGAAGIYSMASWNQAVGGPMPVEVETLRELIAGIQEIRGDLFKTDVRLDVTVGLGDHLSRAIFNNYIQDIHHPTDDEFALLLASMSMGQFLPRVRAARSLERDPSPFLPNGLELVVSARRIATDEDRAFVWFFDLGERLIRVDLASNGLLSGREIDRGMAHTLYLRFCSLSDELERVASGRGQWAHDVELRDCVHRLADCLLEGISARALTILPHGFLHDGFAGALPAWSDGRQVLSDQSPSLACYLAFRQNALRIPVPRDRPVVLLLVAGDIALYRDRVSSLVARALNDGNEVIRFLVAHHERDPGLDSNVGTRLERWSQTGWTACTYPHIDPVACVWLSHGRHSKGKDSSRPDAFCFSAIHENLGVRVNSEDLGSGDLILPLLEHREDRGPVRILIDSESKGVRIGWQYCRLALVGACSSGRIAPDLGEEMPSLIRGFFLAGIPTVVAATWTVLTPPSRPGSRSSIELLWIDLLEALTATGDRGAPTISAAVRAARQRASAAHERSFATWGHLALFGYGDLESPFGRPAHATS
ncbi:MAG: hypothetical protein HY909_15875 [Deltaproteobacteria bacterium]|nr:hypothetical protein [Deltaproteobacteria bacterium]